VSRSNFGPAFLYALWVANSAATTALKRKFAAQLRACRSLCTDVVFFYTAAAQKTCMRLREKYKRGELNFVPHACAFFIELETLDLSNARAID